MEIDVQKKFYISTADYLLPLYSYIVSTPDSSLSKKISSSFYLEKYTPRHISFITKVSLQAILEFSLLLVLTGSLPILFSITLNTFRIFQIWSYTLLTRTILLALEDYFQPGFEPLSVSNFFNVVMPLEFTRGTLTRKTAHAFAYYLLYGNLPKKMRFITWPYRTPTSHVNDVFKTQVLRRNWPKSFNSLQGILPRVFKISPITSEKVLYLAAPVLSILQSVAFFAIATKCSNTYVRTFFQFMALKLARDEDIRAGIGFAFDKNHSAPHDNYSKLNSLGMNRWAATLPAFLNFLGQSLFFSIKISKEFKSFVAKI